MRLKPKKQWLFLEENTLEVLKIALVVDVIRFCPTNALELAQKLTEENSDCFLRALIAFVLLYFLPFLPYLTQYTGINHTYRIR